MEKKKVKKESIGDFQLNKLSMKATWLLVAMMFILLIIICAFLIHKQNQEKAALLNKQSNLQLELEAAEKISVELDQRDAIANKPESIEQIAREQLGMIKDDEILIEG